MRKFFLTTLAALAVSAGAGAATITIFNTGVNNSNAVLSMGTVDPHYTLTSSVDTTGPGPSAYVDNTTAYPIPPWTPLSSTSAWISPSTNVSGNLGIGNYVYTTLFTLPAGFTSASLSGQWATDNSGAIQLNGNAVGTASNTFTSYTPFSITSGFVAGTNTLAFTVNNTYGPTGVRVEVSGTYTTRTLTTAAAVPEPASLPLVGGALIALGALARRLR